MRGVSRRLEEKKKKKKKKKKLYVDISVSSLMTYLHISSICIIYVYDTIFI